MAQLSRTIIMRSPSREGCQKVEAFSHDRGLSHFSEPMHAAWQRCSSCQLPVGRHSGRARQTDGLSRRQARLGCDGTIRKRVTGWLALRLERHARRAPWLVPLRRGAAQACQDCWCGLHSAKTFSCFLLFSFACSLASFASPCLALPCLALLWPCSPRSCALPPDLCPNNPQPTPSIQPASQQASRKPFDLTTESYSKRKKKNVETIHSSFPICAAPVDRPQTRREQHSNCLTAKLTGECQRLQHSAVECLLCLRDCYFFCPLSQRVLSLRQNAWQSRRPCPMPRARVNGADSHLSILYSTVQYSTVQYSTVMTTGKQETREPT